MRRIAIALVWAWTIGLPVGAQEPEVPAAEVEAQDPAERKRRLEFQQDRARAQLAELEDRMFQLAELLRSSEPDDSARLVLGLRKAREELIHDEMEEIRRLIAEEKWTEAEERQRQVLFRLEELRDLLLSTDLDLLLKLERLRRLNAALARLGQVEDALLEQGESLRDIEQESDDQKRRRRLRGALLGAEENRSLAEVLEGEVDEALGSQPAAREGMNEAIGSMLETENALEGAALGEARAETERTGEALDRVEGELRRAREELLWELQPYIRRTLIDSLARMRDHQEEVNGAMRQALIDADEASGEPIEEAVLDERVASRLFDRQRTFDDILRDTAQLVAETEFSVAMPSVLEYMRLWEQPILEALPEGVIQRQDLAAGRRNHAKLEAVLDILLEEENRWNKNRRRETRRIIKLVSELKGARTMQGSIRDDTAWLDSLEEGSPYSHRGEAILNTMQDLEARLTDMMEELDARYWSEMTQGAQEG